MLQHLDFEPAGAIREWADRRGHDLRLIRVDAGQNLPQPGETDLLIILGGFFDFGRPELLWFENEKKILREHIDAQTKIFAICGGAQLITFLLGGTVFASATPEVGWHHVTFENERYLAFHWHSYCFSLPPNARPVSTSTATDLQGFRFGKSSIAVQFHPEVTDQIVRDFILRLTSPANSTFHVQTGPGMLEQLEPGLKSSRFLLEKILSSLEP